MLAPINVKYRRIVPRLLALVLVTLLAVPAIAQAAGNPPGQPSPTGEPAGTATNPVSSMTTKPAGFNLTGNQVLAITKRNATVKALEQQYHGHLTSYVYTLDAPSWQVGYYTKGTNSQEVALLYVNEDERAVTQVWTGHQIAWSMARGYPGAFGRMINAWYVWLPLCVLFFLPFFPWRRKPTLWHLDLLVMEAFSVSLFFFNRSDIGLSVPLVYPELAYFLVRMVLLGFFGKGKPSQPLRVTLPLRWLTLILIFLVGFRIGLNVVNSNVIDVGYAGVIGADKIIHNQPLYGNWPSSNAEGDTYAPFTYFAYVPAYLVFGWSGQWDGLPTAHAAAILFDLLTMLGLFLLGRSMRGPPTGTLLAYLWAAFPFTTFTLCCNSNDALVSCMLVFCLLVLRWSVARGIGGALAAMTKFAPFALAPLLLRGIGPPPKPAQVIKYCLAYGVTVGVLMIIVFARHDWYWFWHDSIQYQAGRPAPFSIWGLWGGNNHVLRIPERAVLGVGALMAIAALRWPRGDRSLIQVAAIAAAIIICLQCGISYWFYLYIVWFFPLVMIVLVLSHPAAEQGQPAAEPPGLVRLRPVIPIAPVYE
jgi:hypothetical protein